MDYTAHVLNHRFSIVVVSAFLCLFVSFKASAQDKALGLSLENHVEYRLRLESLQNDYRPGAADSSVLFHRLLLQSTLTTGAFFAHLEIQDSRAAGIDSITPPSTVNPTDVLQAYVGLEIKNPFNGPSLLNIKLGRMTLDLGSRRLVARNRYRNTINGFTGALVQLKKGRLDLKAFALFPVERRPADPLQDARQSLALDKEDIDHIFGGFFLTLPKMSFLQVELYTFLNHINNPAFIPNTILHTTGFRASKRPETSSLDFEIESVFQWGQSPSFQNDESLGTLAFFTHAILGYTFDSLSNPRLEAGIDYATGDNQSGDDTDNRFNTLFGQPRGDFGPTGIYGAFTRVNVISPLVSLQGNLHKELTWKLRTRIFWLADKNDAWIRSLLIDPTGSTGRYIGTQPEFQLKWQFSKSAFVEAGGVVLIRGGFAKNALGGHSENSWMMYNDFGFRF